MDYGEAMTHDDEPTRPRSLNDLLRADIERDAGLPPQHAKPGKVAKVAVGIIIAMLTFGVVATVNSVVSGARNDSTAIRTDPVKCEELIFGHTELILTQATSSKDFGDRMKAGGTAAQLYPECRGLTHQQSATILDRVTARLAPMVTARALEWAGQTGS